METIKVIDSLHASLDLALPEVIMALGAMALMMYGVFRGEKSFSAVSWGAFGLIVVTGLSVMDLAANDITVRTIGFSGAFVVEPFSIFLKYLILAGSGAAVLMAMDFMKREKLARFEYPVLVVLATLGMMIMVSANDLISLYMGLELQSLALYVLAAFNRDSLRSTESGLKYFVLGAVSSGLLLYGCSLLYGFTGTTNFDALAKVAAGDLSGSAQMGLIFGITFLLAGLAFKISAVPFHMWTPDVYEGSPTPVVAFFAAAPKIAAMGLFIRVTVGLFPVSEGVEQPWQQIVVFVAIASMVLGAFAAIGQTNIKRLMAYSSIGHMGYALVGLSAGTKEGVDGVLLYMLIYLFTVTGVFVCILAMRRKEGMVEHISDLAGMSQNHKIGAFVLSMLFFSLAGIPPLAGFWGKLFVFLPAIQAGYILLVVIGALASVVSAFYYLRIVKIIYFDEPEGAFQPQPMALRLILAVSAIFTLGLTLFLQVPREWTSFAAGSLF
ncbi:MAG: NADH-quinone oxidoreductase subunit NuoN [Alphaproteobacteria bacterium]|nr:MAG: NADH-quinone oxidoreductase subunit NuoN [Alphaproteobacteria bacterium]